MRYIRKHTEGNYSRRIFCMLLCLCMVFSQMSFAFAENEDVSADSSADTGTQEEQSIDMSTAFVYTQAEGGGTGSWGWATDYESYKVFTIASDNDWNAFAQCVNAGNTLSGVTVKLAKDVDITKAAQQMITGTFSGTLDGQGYTLEGININITSTIPQPLGSTGLFMNVEQGGNIKNLTVKGKIELLAYQQVPVVQGNIGALIATGTNCTVENVVANVDIEIGNVNIMQGNVGTLVGTATNSVISGCTVSETSNVTGYTGYKSIAGSVTNSTVKGCVSYIDGVDIAAGSGTFSGNFFLDKNRAVTSTCGTGVTEKDNFKTYELVYSLNDAIGSDVWMLYGNDKLVNAINEGKTAPKICMVSIEPMIYGVKEDEFSNCSATIKCGGEEAAELKNGIGEYYLPSGTAVTMNITAPEGNTITYKQADADVTITSESNLCEITFTVDGDKTIAYGVTSNADMTHITHYSCGESGSGCITGINLADYANDLAGLKTALTNGQKYFYIDSWKGWKTFAEYINNANATTSATRYTATSVFYGCTVYLTHDIDLSKWKKQEPVGKLTILTLTNASAGSISSITYNGFNGTFDGKGHTIKGINITAGNGKATGLFAYTYGGTFKNFAAEGSINVSGGNNALNTGGIGGIVGIANNVEMNNVHNKINVTSSNTGVGDSVGGLCGTTLSNQAKFEGCCNSGTLIGKKTVGGLLGTCKTVISLNKCYNTGSIQTEDGSSYAGGLIGDFNAEKELKITHCYNRGSISGGKNAGLAGEINNSSTSASCIINGSFSDTTSDLLAFNTFTIAAGNKSHKIDEETILYKSSQKSGKGTNVTEINNWKNVWVLNQSDGANTFTLDTTDEGNPKVVFADAQSPIVSQVTLKGYTESEAATAKVEAKEGEILNTENNTYYIKNGTKLKITVESIDANDAEAMVIMHEQGSTAYAGSRRVSGTLLSSKNLEFVIPAVGEQNKNLEVLYGTKAEAETVANYEWYEKNPTASEFEISTASDLLGFAALVNGGMTFQGKTVKLAENINLSQICGEDVGNWTPIGTTSNKFKGSFDGNDKKIEGLYIKPPVGVLSYQGLFSYVDGAEIKNLTVSGSIENCMASAGIVANAANSKIENCINGVEISIYNAQKPSVCGGIVGTVTGTGYIKNCKNEAELSGMMTAGGIIGSHNGKVTIENCTNDGEISLKLGNAGGIAGTYNYAGTEEQGIYLCKNNKLVSTTGANAGGIAALFNGVNSTNNKIAKCENYGTVSAASCAGGIVGYANANSNNYKAYLTNSVNRAAVTTKSNAGVCGGLIGKLEIQLSNKNYKAIADVYNSFSYASGIKAIGREINTNTATIGQVGTGTITYKHIYYLDNCNAGMLADGDAAQAALTADMFKASGIVKKLNEDGNDFWGWNPGGSENLNGALYPVFNGFKEYPVHEVRFVPFTPADQTDYTAAIAGKELTVDENGSYYDFSGAFAGNASIQKQDSVSQADDLVAILICNGKTTVYHTTAKIEIPSTAGNVLIYYGSPANYESFVYTDWYNDSETSFTIETAGQLKSVAQLVNEGITFEGKTLTLANDIDLSGVCNESAGSWQPIGTTAHPFKGTFNGNSKTISGLYINNTSENEPQGLFGYTYDATVKNFAISGEVTNSKAVNTGGVIGTAGGTKATGNAEAGKIEITDIEANVTVRGAGTYTGGIVGYIDAYNSSKYSGAIVTACRLVNRGNCAYTGESETSYVGGVIGGLRYGDIENESGFTKSRNDGNIANDKGIAGGLVGKWESDYTHNTKTTYIENVFNTGNVIANKAAGVIGDINIAATEGKATLNLKRALNYGTITGKRAAYGVTGKPDGSKGTCKTEQLYYLDRTLTGEASEAELGAAKTSAQFATGEIAFDLDNGASNNRSGVWGQSTANNRPEFYNANTAPLVYKLSVKTTGCNLTQRALTNLNILSTVKEGDIANHYVTATFGTIPFISWEAIGTTNEYVLNTVHIKNQKGEEIPATVDEENNTISFSVPSNTNLSAEIECIRVPNLGADMKLILHGNGGKIGEEEQTEIATVVGNRFNTLTELSGAEGFKNGKYEFTGWYLDEECTRAVDMSSRMVPEDRLPLTIDLYAGWDKTTPYYTVTLDANGGTFVADSIEETVEKSTVETVEAPAAEPAAEPVEEPAAEPTVEPTIEIINPVLDVKEGNAVDLTAYGADRVTREGYTFTGWFFDTEMHLPYSGEAISEDATLYAGWKAAGSAQKLIDFDANGGYFTVNGQNSQRITHYYAYADNDSQVTLEGLNVPVVARDIKDGYGYTFAGWFTAETPVAPETSWDGSESVTGDIKLYANWTEKSFAEYIADQKAAQQGGETGETGSLSFVIKDIPTLNAFKAYVADCVSKGTSTAADSFALGADLTLDDSWTSGINGFEGTFDGNGHTLTYANAGASIFVTVKGTVSNINVTGTATANGGIADTLLGGSITNCTVKSGSCFNGGDAAGGIVGTISTDSGSVSGGTVSGCTIEDGVAITGGNYVGGIAGCVIGSDDKGSANISDCKVEKATIEGAGCSGNPAAGSGAGGLGGILGYGAGNISKCMVSATIQATTENAYGIGGIVGVKGSTQGSMSIEKCGFTGAINANGAGSVGGILGSNMRQREKDAEITDVYVSGSMQLGTGRGGNVGGIMGSSVGTGRYISIENAYWKGTIDTAAAPFDTIAANSCTTVSNAYYSNADGYASSQSGATGKPASAFLSGEVAYELDKNHNPRGTWTQGETGPIFNTEGDNGIIHKVEVDKTQEITWEDGTTATITTTISSDLSDKAGLTECNTVFVKNGAKVTTKVEGIPAAKVVKNSDGSTTTTNYNVQIKDKAGDQVIFDSANPTADIRINKDLAAGGTGGSSTATTGSGSGSGGGTGGGTGTGDQTGQGDGTGTGDGKGDGDQSGDGQGDGGQGSDGQGGQQGDGTGIIGDKGDKPHGGNGTGKDVTPSVVPKPNMATPAENTVTQEVKNDPAPTQASEEVNHQQNDQPQSGGQSQGGGEQGQVQPESKIYKLIKSVTNTIKDNPVASAAIAIAIAGIVGAGALNRKRKEDFKKK